MPLYRRSVRPTRMGLCVVGRSLSGACALGGYAHQRRFTRGELAPVVLGLSIDTQATSFHVPDMTAWTWRSLWAHGLALRPIATRSTAGPCATTGSKEDAWLLLAYWLAEVVSSRTWVLVAFSLTNGQVQHYNRPLHHSRHMPVPAAGCHATYTHAVGARRPG